MNKRSSLFLFLVLPILVLVGCSSFQKEEETLWLSQDVSIDLPRDNCNKNIKSVELLTVEYKDMQKQLLVAQNCSSEGLSLVVMLPVGKRLLTIERSNGSIKVTKHLEVPLPFKPEQILWDVLFTQLDIDQLQAVLPKGYEVKELVSERVLIGATGEKIARVNYAATQPVLLENIPFGYTIKIKKLQ